MLIKKLIKKNSVNIKQSSESSFYKKNVSRTQDSHAGVSGAAFFKDLFKASLVFLFFCFFLSSCKTIKKPDNFGSNNNLTPSIERRKGEKKLSSKDRIDFEYLFFNANKEKILGNYDLAEADLLQALRIYPNSAATMYELATIYTFKNNKKQSLNFSKKAALMDANNNWYQLLYISCLKENKQLPEIANVYKRLLKKQPQRIDYYYELANTYLSIANTGMALKTYEKIEDIAGVSEDASLQKFKIYKALKKNERAQQELEKLIKAFPEESKYYGILGELYQDTGQLDKALVAYNNLLEIDPENALVHLSLADLYRIKKQSEKSFEEIKIAFRCKDLDIDIKVKILLSYYSITEKYVELKNDAEELCKIITSVHADEAKAFSIYGDFLYRDKKLELAKAQFKKAISLDKEKFAIWNQLLVIESELMDFIAMQNESKEAIELFPNQALAYFYNGASHIQLKNYKEAILIFNTGIEFVYDETILIQFYASIGDAQNSLKNYNASDSAYNKVLEIDPNNVYVLNNYAYYLSLRNTNLEKAEIMSKKSNEIQPNNNSYEDTYGWVLYQMKKFDDAKVWIGKALANGGKNNGILLEHYGDILYKLGETEEALKYWIDAKKTGDATNNIDVKIANKKLYE